jgi:site-specific recombinase XerD
MTTVPATTITIDEAITRFATELVTRKHPAKTVDTYHRDLLYWRTWLTENTISQTVTQLSRDDITEYLSHLARDGEGRAKGAGATQGLSATTLKKKLAAFRKFAAYCVDQGYHFLDITAGIKSPRAPRKEPAFLTQHEYKALLYEAQRRNKPRDYAILMTLLQCGLRESELVRLTLSDVNLDRRELTVKGRKGGVDTDIPLPTPAIDALVRWFDVRPEVPTDRVFISKTGKPLDERTIRYLVRYYIKKAGITKPASTHTLRHTFGSQKANKGVDIAQLQYWMGHKRKETTLTYIHLIKKRAPELMEASAL